MAWKVWFDDSTTYDDTKGAVATIPNKGVVAIAVTDAPGRVEKDKDWYIHSSTLGFRGISLHELLRQVCDDVENISLVRQGAVVSDTIYNNVVAAAETFATG